MQSLKKGRYPDISDTLKRELYPEICEALKRELYPEISESLKKSAKRPGYPLPGGLAVCCHLWERETSCPCRFLCYAVGGASSGCAGRCTVPVNLSALYTAARVIADGAQ